jgi:hypothetical protein
MPQAPLGLTRDAKHVYTWNDGTTVVSPLTSVTTAIGAVDKSGVLVNWAKLETAKCAVRNLALVGDMVTAGGPASAVDWLKRIPDYQRDLAADLGTRVHSLAEQVGRGDKVELSPIELPYIAAFRRFLEESGFVIELSEFMVANLTLGYAGTGDLIGKLDGKRWLLDIKTSQVGKGPYAETGLQLAGYAKAEFIGRPGEPTKHKLPPCQRFAVLHLSPAGYRLVPYAVDAETWRTFRAALVVSRWLGGQAKTIMNGAAK